MIKEKDLKKFLKDKNPWITFLYFFTTSPFLINEDVTLEELKDSYSKFEEVISKLKDNSSYVIK